MPPLTRWYVKLALVYFFAALLAATWLAAQPVLKLSSALVSGVAPVYFHMFMVGWVTQLIFGIVYWMFPKFTLQKPRGFEWLAWATFGLINAGLLLRVAGEPLNALHPGSVWGWMLAVSAVLQWLGGTAFVVNTFPRVKEK